MNGKVFLSFALVLGCISVSSARAVELELMSYNVENLFDAEHDAGKDDWTFLPNSTEGKQAECEKIPQPHYKKDCLETDWTEAKLNLKLRQIQKVIEARGQLPNFLALSEVENEAVIRRLAELLGYDGLVVTNSPDARGIDVALLYRTSANVKFLTSSELELKVGELIKPTRNILQTEFLIAGEHRLNIYVNHWPSQEAPTETRLAVAKELKKLMAKAAKKTAGVFQIATGDFNVTEGEMPNPIRDVMLSAEGGASLNDVDTLYWEYQKKSKTDYQTKFKTAPGTYFFPAGMQWNKLDKFLVSDSLLKGKKLRVRPESYEIFSPQLIRRPYTYDKDFFAGTVITGVPNRCNHNASDAKLAGFSDHFPIVVRLSVD